MGLYLTEVVHFPMCAACRACSSIRERRPEKLLAMLQAYIPTRATAALFARYLRRTWNRTAPRQPPTPAVNAHEGLPGAVACWHANRGLHVALARPTDDAVFARSR